MRYEEPVFRPPSEAESLILQVTVGCSHNACLFCGMYRSKRYRVRSLDEVLAEIREAALEWPDCPRVFLGDGDALAAPTDFLVTILETLRHSFPRLRRVSLYATPMNLNGKDRAELETLRRAGLSLFYLGLESGDDDVLRAMAKGATAAEAVRAVVAGRESGMRASVMVLLGLGGREGWKDHAKNTARAVNAMQPEFLSALTWFPVSQAPLYRKLRDGRFTLPDDGGILEELSMLIEYLALDDTVFRANHASNPLPLSGRLSRDKEGLLTTLASARKGKVSLRPAFLRGT